jgi:hypothetical protein
LLVIRHALAPGLQAFRESVESEINDRRSEQREYLTHDQTTDNSYAERVAQFGTNTGAEHQWQRGKQR